MKTIPGWAAGKAGFPSIGSNSGLRRVVISAQLARERSFSDSTGADGAAPTVNDPSQATKVTGVRPVDHANYAHSTFHPFVQHSGERYLCAAGAFRRMELQGKVPCEGGFEFSVSRLQEERLYV